jgi:hypothetical protein
MAKLMDISFETTADEFFLIGEIADRANVHGERRMGFIMDLCATHANGTPMDFERLLNADETSFWHDLRGIARHLNRETGQLDGMFLPRFARKEDEGVYVR